MATKSVVPQKDRASSNGSRKQMISRARLLRAEKGWTQKRIAEELGVSISTIGTWVPKVAVPPEDAINGAVLVKWIKAHGEDDPYRGLLVNGLAMEPSLQRAYFRWRKEGVNPRLDSAERALRDLRSTFREFEEWAQAQDLNVWASGVAPSWYLDDGNSRLLEDLDSIDPEWVTEARQEGTELGVLDKLGRRPRKVSRLPVSQNKNRAARQRQAVAA